MEKNVFEEAAELRGGKGEEVPGGPDDERIRAEIEASGETLEEQPAERTYASKGSFEIVDVSEEALAGLSPAERKQKRYANAASYFHQYDAMRKTLGVDDFPEAEGLRQKAHDLYEEADRLYGEELVGKITEAKQEEQEEQEKIPEPQLDTVPGAQQEDKVIELTEDDLIPESKPEPKIEAQLQPKPQPVLEPEAAPLDPITESLANSQQKEQRERIQRNNQIRKQALDEEKSRAEIDRIANNERRKTASELARVRAMNSGAVQPTVQPVQETSRPARRGFFSSVGSWFRKSR